MSDITTIQETFTLPSLGKIYDTEFNPQVTLRSMTTAEEMKRLSFSESEYKVMSDIIEDCMKEKLPVHVYDMCLGDYQFLLHKIRTVTYGPEYKMLITCPNCGETTYTSVNLDDIEVFEFNDDIVKDREITLPVSKKKILLSFQTPRMLDGIKEKSKERKRKSKQSGVNYEILYATMSLISKVDGVELNEFELEKLVKSLPAKDLLFIVQKGNELNGEVGLSSSVFVTCENCGYELQTQFRIQSEFFGPQILE